MSFIDHLLSCFAPHICVGCGYEGKLLCNRCALDLSLTRPRCYRCLRDIYQPNWLCETCPPNSLEYISSACMYADIAKDLVWRLKSGGTQKAAQVMAELMTAHKQVDTGHSLLVPVPTATSRVRQRGYDQARLLARALSRTTGLPYSSLLARQGQTHQVGSSRSQRLQQLHGAFRVTQPIPQNTSIILIDDVLTTGATLESAAQALSRAGAKRIRAWTFARA